MTQTEQVIEPVKSMGGSLSFLLHAPAKVGKTTLSTTCPPPICVLDAEGGWRFVRTAGFKTETKLRRTEWNPLEGPPPRYDGTWDYCHVLISEWRTLTSAYDWLRHVRDHDFKSIILDSITESQRKLKENLRGTDQMRIQDWGSLLTHMDIMIRGMRDLPLIPKPNPVEMVMFIAETEFKNNSWRPAMQGQIGNTLPYWVDICGYLYTANVKNEEGQPTGDTEKRLLIGQGVNESIISGERVQGALPTIINNPNVSNMMKSIFNGGE